MFSSTASIIFLQRMSTAGNADTQNITGSVGGIYLAAKEKQETLMSSNVGSSSNV